MNDKSNDAAVAPSGRSARKWVVPAIAGALMLAVGGFGGPVLRDLLATPPAEDAAVLEEPVVDDDRPALYASLQPPLVVNFKDSSGESHYMQVTMEVMARDQKVIDAVKLHSAAIRNGLILLFSGSVDPEGFNTRERKEQMLAEALAEIRSVLEERIGTGGVEAVYFTSLIVQ